MTCIVGSSTLASTSTAASEAVDDDAEEVGNTVDDCFQYSGNAYKE